MASTLAKLTAVALRLGKQGLPSSSAPLARLAPSALGGAKATALAAPAAVAGLQATHTQALSPFSSSAVTVTRPLEQQQAHARSFSSGDKGDGTHDDFKPQYKPQETIQDVAKVIENDIQSHKVFVYMKGVPEMPQCGFSNMVCRILDTYEIKYGSRNVLEDMEVRQGIKDFTQWPTIPQIFVDGEFVGGCDILMEMHKNGELTDMVKN